MKSLVKTLIIALLVAPIVACSSQDDEIVTPPENTNEENKEENKGKSESDSIVIDMLPKTRSIELTDAQKTYVAQSNDFSFNLFRAISKDQGQKSTITSPLSVSYVLGMLNCGAQGSTSEEITTLLGFGAKEKQAVSEFHKKLIEDIPQVDGTVELDLANLVSADKKVLLEPAYQQDVQNFYKADVSMLDFSSPDALSYLNSWCSNATKGMIPTILDNLDPSALLVLMNAIYFKATWSEKFDPANTKDGSFAAAAGSKTLPLMHRSATILYEKNETYSSICLPYGGGDKWSMTVMLPNEGKTIEDVLSGLSESSWNAHLDRMRSHIVDILLPRFSTQSEVQLNDILAGLGAPTMFDPAKADFSLMTQNYKTGLFVSLLKQKAAVEVSEEGTKLSAVTVTPMAMLPNFESATFHAIRPFVYIIREASSGAVFFIGTFQG